jgi:hypothetical protein
MFESLQLAPAMALLAGGILLWKDKRLLFGRWSLGPVATKGSAMIMCVVAVAWIAAIILNETNWIDMP